MPRFTLTSPDGKKYTVTAPEGATQQQAFDMLQKQLNRPEPGALAGAGRFARGAARGVAGNVADAWRFDNPVTRALFPPVQALHLAAGKPGDKPGEQDPHTAAAEQKVEKFANAPTPSGEESAGWMASQTLPFLAGPESAVTKGVQKGGKIVWQAANKAFAEKTGQEIPAAVQSWLGGLSHSQLGHLATSVLGHGGSWAWRLGAKPTERIVRSGAQAAGRTLSSENPPDDRQRPPEAQ